MGTLLPQTRRWKMKKTIWLFVVGWIAVLGFVPLSWAYEVVQVTNGGKVKGVVKLRGAPPADPVLKIDKDMEYCGMTQKARKFMVGSQGEIQHAIVVVDDVKKGKASPRKAAEVKNHKCQFEPLVGVAYVGGDFVVKNSDPIFHNTHLGLRIERRERTLYNLAMPKQGMVIKKPVKKPGLVKVSCDAHSWMRAYLFASEHPYVSVTDKDGQFEMPDLPPGKYALWVWHEGLGEMKRPFEVTAGKTTEISIEFKK